MTQSAQIRARAAQLVAQVAHQGRSLDSVLTAHAGDAHERGLLRALTYGAVRWHIRLDALLAKLSSRPPHALDPSLRALIIVGLYQLLHTDIAAHAAVAETVEATRALKQPRAAGFVNALLRRAQREGTALLAELDRDIAIRTAHPFWLAAQLAADWPDHHEQMLDANNAHPPMWLRVNRRRIDVASYQTKLLDAGLNSERSAAAPDALRLATPCDVNSLPGFAAGEASVQDAAAQLAAHFLAPRPGDRVLDACAAPGGKTCHLLELQPDLAELVAVDVSAARLRRVRENLERLGLTASVQEGDIAQPGGWWDGVAFQRILLDVPCSATGVIRRHPDIKLLRREGDLVELQRRQGELLRAAWTMLAPEGRLVYATCSSLRCENAAVIADFLAERADARELTIDAFAPKAVRTEMAPHWAHGLAIPVGKDQMDGFYYACLEKGAS